MPQLNFKHHCAKLSGDKSLLNEIAKVTNDIHAKFTIVDLAPLGISEYNQRYLKSKFVKPYYEYSIIVYMFGYLLAQMDAPRDKLTFVDGGAGAGLNCLAAKALGIGTVIYSDIYDLSARDAEVIGNTLGFPANHYLVGELDSVAEFMRKKGMPCEMVASHDVLEHVYDVELSLGQIASMPTRRMAIWQSSAANPYRPKTVQDLTRHAINCKFNDRPVQWGDKPIDTNKAFVSIRKEIILDVAPGLDEATVDRLARLTRGMMQKDIEAAIRKFVGSGEMPPKPEHPTNTCDPYTGNWAERLMDPYWLLEVASDKGLQLEVAPGFWAGQPNNPVKHIAKILTNALISVNKVSALRFSPYYVLRGIFRPSLG